ncbi:hypothetical protein [Krasilnikovia sp. M28-CT-15]|uniref:hypothetical protein n=1 Tax=Krasilnikovia sp. M28-CT-15 TaxID=3373540 RepID=UPI003876C4A6
MPDREPHQENREGHSARLPRLLVWAGAGLAPVAATVALLGGDTSMRVAVLLLAVCVVLIGASLLIRSDPVLMRIDVEDRVAAEVETLRDQLRAEVAAAARATHHHVQTLQDELTQLRGAARVEPGTATGGRATVPAPMPPGAGVSGGSAPMPHGAGVPSGSAAMPHGAGGPAGAAPMPNGTAPMPNGAAPMPNGTAPMPNGTGVARPGLPRPRGPVPAPPPSVARPPRNPPIAALPRPAPSPAPTPQADTGHRPVDGRGRRRADITAVDLGYTGRRARPDDTDDEFEYGPEPGDPGYGVTAPDPYDPDPLGDEYDWRQPSGHRDQRSRW